MESTLVVWAVRALLTVSVVSYTAHVWLVWRRVSAFRRYGLAAADRRGRRHRVRVAAHIETHHGEPFLFRE